MTIAQNYGLYLSLPYGWMFILVKTVKVIYIHQYFNTPEDGGSLRSYYLAKALIAQGIQVDLITSHKQSRYEMKEIDGIRVHYLPVYYDNTLGAWARIYAFLKFLWLSLRKAQKLAPADYCYATSTPLTVGLVAFLLKRTRKIPYFFEVRDLWPEAPIQLGFIRFWGLKKILEFIEKKIYQNAQAIVGLSPGMCEHIHQLVPQQKVMLIPNMSDCSFFQSEMKLSKLLEKYQISHSFVISYIGTIGLANHLEYLLEVARYFQDQLDEECLFLIVGKGGQLASIQKCIRDWSLSNVRLLPYMDKEGVKEILNISDAVYISFLSLPVLQTSSPNKFFDALAAGKLCIVNTEGWLKSLVEEWDCGFFASPYHPEVFYKSLQIYLEDSSFLKHSQNNARRLAEEKFSVYTLTKRWLTLFSS